MISVPCLCPKTARRFGDPHFGTGDIPFCILAEGEIYKKV